MSVRQTALQRAVTRGNWPAGPLTVDGVTGNTLLFSGACLWRGYSVGNLNAGAITIEVYDGLDAKGSPIGYINLAAASSDKLWMGTPGVDVELGLFLAVSAGPIKGAFWFSPLDDLELDRLPGGGHDDWPGTAHGQGS